MGAILAKSTVREITGLALSLQTPRKLLPGVLPEDLMERIADRLEDPLARSLLTTACGFTRLLQVIATEVADPDKLAMDWLKKRFSFLPENAPLLSALEAVTRASLLNPNYNITFKRLTAILTPPERAVLSEGLLDVLYSDGLIPPEKDDLLEKTLTQVMLSQQGAMEILQHWLHKRHIRDIPAKDSN